MPTSEPRHNAVLLSPALPVFFLSDSTGISAETMGNALLLQFPGLVFERRPIPFITTRWRRARRVVALLDEAMDGPLTPLVFTTTAMEEVRQELHRTRCPLIDFFDLQLQRVEAILQTPGQRLDEPVRSAVAAKISAYASPRDYFVRRDSEGVATLAAEFAPKRSCGCRTSSPTSTPTCSVVSSTSRTRRTR